MIGVVHHEVTLSNDRKNIGHLLLWGVVKYGM